MPLSRSRDVQCAVEGCTFWMQYDSVRRHCNSKHTELPKKAPFKQLFKERDDTADNDYKLDHIDSIYLPDESLTNPFVLASFIMPNGRTQKSDTYLRDVYKEPMFLKFLPRAASKQASGSKKKTRAVASQMTLIVKSMTEADEKAKVEDTCCICLDEMPLMKRATFFHLGTYEV